MVGEGERRRQGGGEIRIFGLNVFRGFLASITKLAFLSLVFQFGGVDITLWTFWCLALKRRHHIRRLNGIGRLGYLSMPYLPLFVTYYYQRERELPHYLNVAGVV